MQGRTHGQRLALLKLLVEAKKIILILLSFIFRADRTTCTTCYSTDPANALGLGIAAMAAIQAIVGIHISLKWFEI